MGVDYRALLYVGRQFEDAKEAKEWYEKFVKLTEEDEQYIEEESFSEYLSGETEIEGEVLNAYNGYGFVLGFDIGSTVCKLDMFASEVALACLKWKEMFGNEPYEIIHTVKVY